MVVDRIAPGATFCALVRLTISRAAAEANRIWGGVHASKGGVHLSVPFIYKLFDRLG